jgi:molybdopterin synthase sulfur carrier subunit
MKIRYFAWLREKIGTPEEEVTVPPEVRTVQELIDWLKQRTPRHEAAFGNTKLVRCAIDLDFAAADTAIGGATEIAFFPPVTGG